MARSALNCSLRSLRIAPGSRGLPHSLATSPQTALTSFARSSRQRRAILVAAHRAGKPSSSSSLADGKACRLAPCTLLAPLAAAAARWPLPSSLVRRRKACLLTRSSRTAARQPRSARRCAMRHDEDAPEGQHGPIRPARIGLIEKLLILGNELRPLIIGERLQHRSRPGA